MVVFVQEMADQRHVLEEAQLRSAFLTISSFPALSPVLFSSHSLPSLTRVMREGAIVYSDADRADASLPNKARMNLLISAHEALQSKENAALAQKFKSLVASLRFEAYRLVPM